MLQTLLSGKFAYSNESTNSPASEQIFYNIVSTFCLQIVLYADVIPITQFRVATVHPNDAFCVGMKIAVKENIELGRTCHTFDIFFQSCRHCNKLLMFCCVHKGRCKR